MPTTAEDFYNSKDWDAIVNIPTTKPAEEDFYNKDWDAIVNSSSAKATPTSSYKSKAIAIAKEYGIPANLFLSLINQESGWNPKAKSPAGAMGLGQLMPGTAKGLGVINPWEPEENLRGSAKYLKQQLDSFGGDWGKALAAYNAGPGAVMQYKGIPPYKETINYVTNILNAANFNPIPASTPFSSPVAKDFYNKDWDAIVNTPTTTLPEHLRTRIEYGLPTKGDIPPSKIPGVKEQLSRLINIGVPPAAIRQGSTSIIEAPKPSEPFLFNLTKNLQDVVVGFKDMLANTAQQVGMISADPKYHGIPSISEIGSTLLNTAKDFGLGLVEPPYHFITKPKDILTRPVEAGLAFLPLAPLAKMKLPLPKKSKVTIGLEQELQAAVKSGQPAVANIIANEIDNLGAAPGAMATAPIKSTAPIPQQAPRVEIAIQDILNTLEYGTETQFQGLLQKVRTATGSNAGEKLLTIIKQESDAPLLNIPATEAVITSKVFAAFTKDIMEELGATAPNVVSDITLEILSKMTSEELAVELAKRGAGEILTPTKFIAELADTPEVKNYNYFSQVRNSQDPLAPNFTAPNMLIPPDKIIGRAEIARGLQNVIDIPFDVGKMPKKGVLGFFDSFAKYIKTSKAGDVEVLSHEIGHYIDTQIPEVIKAIKANPTALTQIIDLGLPQATAQGNIFLVFKEGMAEFVRLHVTHPNEAALIAPDVIKIFESIVGKADPLLVKQIGLARDGWQNYLAQTSEQRISSSISTKAPKQKILLSETVTDTQMEMVDKLAWLRRVEERVRGGELRGKTPKSAYETARNIGAAQDKAEDFLTKARFQFDNVSIETGKSLKDILKPLNTMKSFADVGGYEHTPRQALTNYMVAHRALELAGRKLDTGIPISDSINIARNPEYIKAFEPMRQELIKYSDGLVEYLVNARVIKPKDAVAFLSANKEFVPFHRVLDVVIEGKGGTGGFKSPVKRMRGSTGDIIDPLETIIKNTYSYIYLAERTKILNQIVDNALAYRGGGILARQVPPPIRPVTTSLREVMKAVDPHLVKNIPKNITASMLDDMVTIFREGSVSKTEPIISVLRGNIRQYYKIHPKVYEAINNLSSTQAHWLVKGIVDTASWSAQTLRAGVVLAFDFMTGNVLRDFATNLILSKRMLGVVNPFTFATKAVEMFMDVAAAGKDILLGNTRDLTLMKRAGQGMGNLVDISREGIQLKIKDLLATQTPVQKLLFPVMHPIKALQKLTSFSEDINRLAEFRYLTKKGLGLEEAAFGARDLLDFQRTGLLTKQLALNKMAAFYNANLQGWSKFLGEYRKDPVGMSSRLVTSITLPSVLLYFINRDDPRYWAQPEWKRNAFWFIPMGEKLVTIPKPFELGVLFGTIPEHVLTAIDKQDPKQIDNMWTALIQGMPAPPIPTVAIPLIENMANYSQFKNAPIETNRVTNVSPVNRYTEQTSEIAKSISKVTDPAASKLPGLLQKTFRGPQKIEHIITGTTGTLGRELLHAPDKLLRPKSTGEAPYKEPIEQIPGLRRFYARYPPYQSQRIENIYNMYGSTKQIIADIKKKQQEGKFEEATALYTKHEKLVMLYPAILKLIDTFKDARNALQGIAADPKMTGKEKTTEMDRIRIFTDNLAQQFLEGLK